MFGSSRKGITYLSLSELYPLRIERVAKRRSVLSATQALKKINIQQQPVEKTASKEKVAAEAVEEPPQQPLKLRDIQELPPFHFFTKAMFPMELLKMFEK